MRKEFPSASFSHNNYLTGSSLTISHEAAIYASRQWLWEKLTNVSTWSEWDHEVTESRLHCDFCINAEGYLVDRQGNQLIFKITDINHEEAYSNMYFLPMGTKLHFTHMIIGSDAPYQVKFHALFLGPYAAYHFNKFKNDIQMTMQKALSNLSNLTCNH